MKKQNLDNKHLHKSYTLKKILLSCLFFYVVSFSIHAQETEVDCSDLKTGTFIIPADSFVPFSSKIVRKENHQREYISDGSERSSRLKWLSPCSYLMVPSPKKEGEDPEEEIMRQYGGIKVNITSRKGDTIYFTGRFLKAPKEMELNAFMIKIE